MYADAGFAGDLTDSKFTSGATLFLVWAIRYVGRTHRVDLEFVSECFRNDTGNAINFAGTKKQMADLLTK